MRIGNRSLSTSSDVDNWDCIDPRLIVIINYVTLASYIWVSGVSHATLAHATTLSPIKGGVMQNLFYNSYIINYNIFM